MLSIYNSTSNTPEAAEQIKAKIEQALNAQAEQQKVLGQQKKAAEAVLKSEKDRTDSVYHYQRWVGYLFANSSKNGPALDDLKRRAFQPGCQFRRDWANFNPSTRGSFVGAASANQANMSYKIFLDYLAKGISMDLLEDARKRFFTAGCGFLNPADSSLYSADFIGVFK